MAKFDLGAFAQTLRTVPDSGTGSLCFSWFSSRRKLRFSVKVPDTSRALRSMASATR